MKSKYHIIGLMSGTSLDGLDLAYCTFDSKPPFFTINYFESSPYSKEWKKRLQDADQLNAREFAVLDAEITSLFSSLIKKFITKRSITKIDAISSHGHTVFHQPQSGFTVQVGNPSYLAAKTGFTVIGDYRTADIALGGQGAPLVPIGDRELFSDYKNRINLGGFANISFEKDNNTFAFDVCPANMALNLFANKLGYDYDDKGNIAKSGQLSTALLSELNQLEYYHQVGPKSLGKEWFNNSFYPILEKSMLSEADILCTLVEHIAIQIDKVMINGNCLLSGGGTHNDFLVERIRKLSENKITIPDGSIIDYKEALIFAYLGYLRLKEKINVLKSVTGASKDHISGTIHLP